MGTLTVALLGPVEICVDGEPVALAGARQRAMVAALALRPDRVVSIATLVEAIWDDAPPAGAEHTLQQHVSTFRKQVQHHGVAGSALLVTQSPGYLLRVGEVDVRHFDQTTAAGAAAAGVGDWSTAVSAYTAALGLWRGPALADAQGSRVLEAAATRLDGQRLVVAERRIQAMLECGRDLEAVPDLEHLIADHPAREGLWALLMRALYRSGRQADALAAFQRARAELVEELGIEPGPELRELEQAILVQSPSLDRPAPAPRADVLRTTITGGPSVVSARLVLPDGQVVWLAQGPSLLGRDPSAVVRLVDTRVSRQHARIDVAGLRIRILDLGSTNGTTVNGEPITDRELADGDRIGLGGVELRYLAPPG